jgi:hypothetical protein
MSALGQKQTYAVQKGTSALPPIATAKADSCKRSCPLYPRKRTLGKSLSVIDPNLLPGKATRGTEYDLFPGGLLNPVIEK